MSYFDRFKEIYAKHPGTVIGVVGGGLLGLSFAAFGFWRTVVVVFFAALGLYVGLRVDGGDDLYSWPERIKAFIRRK